LKLHNDEGDKIFMTVSIINFFAKDASTKFAQSIKDTGFAIIENHLLEQVVLDQAYKIWHEFFNSTQKNNYQFDQKNLSGFTSKARSEIAKGYKAKDVKEFYSFQPTTLCPPKPQIITHGIFQMAVTMALMMLQWLEQNPPDKALQDVSLTDMVNNSFRTILRVAHYPALTGAEPASAVRSAAHEDINFLAIHPAATAGGLQLLHKNGSWIEIPPDPNLMVVSIGDMLAECSRGFYQATTHRVINPTRDIENTSRLAMCLYLHPRDDVRLSDRYTAGSYLTERCNEIGLTTK
jgi:isopenicillin N synthase-like dioxygenase